MRAQTPDELRRQLVAPRRARRLRRRDGGASNSASWLLVVLAPFAFVAAAICGRGRLKLVDDLPNAAGAVLEWEIGRAVRDGRLAVDLRAHGGDFAEDRVVIERRAGARFVRHGIVKTQRLRLQPEPLLHVRDHASTVCFCAPSKGSLP